MRKISWPLAGWLVLALAINASAEPQTAITVSTITTELSNTPRTMTFSGPVVGREEISVYASVAQGKIQQVMVDEDQRVSAGTVLATIDPKLFQVQRAQQQAVRQRAVAALAQQEASLEEAQALHSQAKIDLKKANPFVEATPEQKATNEHVAEAHAKAAQQAVNMAQADLALADAQLAEADLRLAQATITAPVSGTITTRKAHVGMVLGQSPEPLFVILRDDALEVELEVSGADAARLTPGMTAEIQVVGNNTLYKGKVRRAANQVQRQSQVAKLRVRFDKSPNVILGQFAQVRVNFKVQKAIYLPDAAIRFDGANASVFVVNAGKAIKTTVKLGERSNGLVEIVQGIKEGTQVVTGAVAFLHDGEAVRVAPESKSNKL
ncbi:MAG: efflux RND transporter periplasmic adaptor subunit [Methylophilales bacterium]|nr:efflux RND transporter periplasmic adaptor subunit [Methylophilales bacterium]